MSIDGPLKNKAASLMSFLTMLYVPRSTILERAFSTMCDGLQHIWKSGRDYERCLKIGLTGRVKNKGCLRIVIVRQSLNATGNAKRGRGLKAVPEEEHFWNATKRLLVGRRF